MVNVDRLEKCREYRKSVAWSLFSLKSQERMNSGYEASCTDCVDRSVAASFASMGAKIIRNEVKNDENSESETKIGENNDKKDDNINVDSEPCWYWSCGCQAPVPSALRCSLCQTNRPNSSRLS